MVALTDLSETTILPGPRTRDTEGEKCHVSCAEARGLDWLPWSSNGLEHGLKLHKIAKNGYVYETGDRPTEPRRKSKGISTRQFGGRC
jgi:hypothetical protein